LHTTVAVIVILMLQQFTDFDCRKSCQVCDRDQRKTDRKASEMDAETPYTRHMTSSYTIDTTFAQQ
jgi:hypothetical protein